MGRQLFAVSFCPPPAVIQRNAMGGNRSPHASSRRPDRPGSAGNYGFLESERLNQNRGDGTTTCRGASPAKSLGSSHARRQIPHLPVGVTCDGSEVLLFAGSDGVVGRGAEWPDACLLPAECLPPNWPIRDMWSRLALTRSPPFRPAWRASSEVNSCALPCSWAARPPLRAISRCFSRSIDAKPRF